MAEAAIASAVMGGAVSAYAEYQKGQAEEDAANYNAGVARKNAIAARQKGAEDERQVRIMGRKELGSIRAAYGASGVQADASGMDVLQESAATAELDALKVRHAGEMKGWAYDQDAAIQQRRAEYAHQAKYLGAASKAIGAGSSAAAMSGGGGA